MREGLKQMLTTLLKHESEARVHFSVTITKAWGDVHLAVVHNTIRGTAEVYQLCENSLFYNDKYKLASENGLSAKELERFLEELNDAAAHCKIGQCVYFYTTFWKPEQEFTLYVTEYVDGRVVGHSDYVRDISGFVFLCKRNVKLPKTPDGVCCFEQDNRWNEVHVDCPELRNHLQHIVWLLLNK